MTVQRPRTSAWLACAIAGASIVHGSTASTGTPPAHPDAPTFGESIEVNVVSVDVFVTDKKGQPVRGLSKGDFQLLEDGKPVDISNFQELRTRDAGEPLGAAQQTTPKAPAAPANPAEPTNYVAVYFDDANIRRGNRTRMLQQLRSYLAEHLGPHDRVLLASYDLGLRIETPFTNDGEKLGKALDALALRATSGGEMDRERELALRTMIDLQAVNRDPEKGGSPCSSEVKSPIESYSRTAREAALRSVHGLQMMVSSLSGVPGRKALLLVSDGIPVTPGEELNEVFVQMCGGGAISSGAASTNGQGQAVVGDAPVFDMRGSVEQVYLAPVTPLDTQKYSIAKDLSTLAAHANANRVAIYSLQASGAAALASSSAAIDGEQSFLRIPEVARIQSENYEGALSSLAAETGGRMIFNANQIAQDLGDLWNDLSTHYSLGFSPDRKPDGRQHRVEVKVKQAGLKVRNLQSYRDKPILERAFDRTLAALFYDIQDNPLEVRVDVDAWTPRQEGLYSVPLHLRIPLFKLGILNQNETFSGKLRLMVAAQGPTGALTPLRQIEVPLNIPQTEVLHALGQYYVYNLTLQLKEGEQRVAIGVRDEVTGTASFLAQKLRVGTALAASQP